MQLGKFLALDTETLVLRQVPVENIQFHRRHAVKVVFDLHPEE